MRKIFILLVFILSFNELRSFAQEGPFPSSGIGIIAPKDAISEWYLNFPYAEIDLYNSYGKKCGKIYKKDMLNLMYKLNDKEQAYRVNTKDLAEVSNKGYCLKVFSHQGDYVKVLVNTTEDGFWISVSEIGYLEYVLKSWMEVLLIRKTHLYPMVDVGINLRTEPDQNSKKISLVKGKHYSIDLSGKTSQLWAEVTVRYYQHVPCTGKSADEKPTEEWKGWLKIIDDAGYPNIWFYPEGCK